MPSTKPTALGPMPGARRGRRRHRVAAGDVRIGAVIDVQHHRLRALEQDALAGAPRFVQPLPHRLGERQDARRELEQMLAGPRPA